MKRPRSTTPTKEDSPAKKKNKSIKKPKKSKGPKSGTSDGTVPTLKKSSTPSTATADGQMMAQMLSTFSKMEQSRFEAFQRCALPQNTVQDWLVACLCRKGPTGHPSVARDAAASATSHHRLQLDDLVAPGQANDISMVVATVAKIYAQRLVATAKKLQKKRIIATDDEDDDEADDHDTDKKKDGEAEEVAKKRTGTGAASKNASHTDDHENRPLEPQDIWRAWQHRCQRGLDPGFFLSSTGQSTASNGGDGGWNINLQQEGSIDDMDDYTQRRFAALAAQEEYEKRLDASIAEKEDQEAKVGGEAMDVDP